MHSRASIPLLVLAGLALTLPMAGEALTAQVVASEVSVSRDAATLRLEFHDGTDLEVGFREGRTVIDGSEVGRYMPGDALESSWRGLIGETVQMGPEEVGRHLTEWAPPSDLESASEEVARALTSEFDRRLAQATTPAAGPDPSLLEGQTDDVLRALLRRPERLQQLSAVLDGMEIDELDLRVGQNVRVGEGEVVPATLVVVDGNLTIAGTVQGHVVTLGGTIDLEEGGRVDGDLRWRNGELQGDRGVVAGTIAEVEDPRARFEAELREELRRELPREAATREATSSPWERMTVARPVRNLVSGFLGLLQTVVTFAVLLLLGGAILYLFPRNLKVIGDTVRNEPGRSALVGIAGFVLFFPVWIVGMVALAISIIGIPLLLGWIPFFPVAIALSCVLGFLAIAFAAGESLSERGLRGLEWVDEANALHQMALGIGVFLIAFAGASVVQMAGPWLGFLRGLLLFAGVLGVLAAVTIGFGAVLLSRAGRNHPPAPWTGSAGRPRPHDPGGPPPPNEPAPPFDDEVQEWERELRRRRSAREESGETHGSGGGTATETRPEGAAEESDPPEKPEGDGPPDRGSGSGDEGSQRG